MTGKAGRYMSVASGATADSNASTTMAAIESGNPVVIKIPGGGEDAARPIRKRCRACTVLRYSVPKL